MRFFIVLYICVLTAQTLNLYAEDAFQEFKVKRKNIFEFTKKPEIHTDKDNYTISFAVKDYCDVTVAIENLNGKILCHLASGVLGSNAPKPFQKDSLDQTIFWDSKDDSGKYLDDKSSLKVRVSLGLQAEYEKDLYYSPYKRISSMPVLCAAPEGVYVYEGYGRDHLKLFDHKGSYNKTIYPFPASQLKNVNGLEWINAPDGKEIPNKQSNYKQTLLTSGDNDELNGMTGLACTGLAIRDKKIAVVFEHLNRLSTDGSSGGFSLKGPKTGFSLKRGGFGTFGNGDQIIGPTSLAFSPDGKTVYMTGYMWEGYSTPAGSLQGVFKMNYETNDEISTFAGFKTVIDFGKDDTHFAVPTSVDTDNRDNVYVSDFANDRVQVFDPLGKLLKSLIVKNPAKVLIHQKTGVIYVFSWAVIGLPFDLNKQIKYNPKIITTKVSVFSPYPEMKLNQTDDFPLGPGSFRQGIFSMGQAYQVTLDSWSEEPTFWVVGKKHIVEQADIAANASAAASLNDPNLWQAGIRLMQYKNGKWMEIDNFNSKTKNDIVKISPALNNVQQLYFNHQSEKLYVGEADSAPTGKAFNALIEIDPNTNKSKIVPLPFNPQDIDFDINGLIYLRTMNVLARYETNTWKEIPFDYGAENARVGNDGSMGGKSAPVVSAIMLPATNAVCYHQGGLSVNINGDIAVACHYRANYVKNPKLAGVKEIPSVATYTPIQFPGRLENSTSVIIHVWDKYGKIKNQDIVKGAPQTDGIFIDKEGSLYMMATPPRLIAGKPIDDGSSSTLMKFKNNNNARFLSSEDTPVPLSKNESPNRPKDLRGLWAENVDWLYGGVGFGGFNKAGCACWFARFKLDYFARSFVPEPIQFSVAVLDSSGNLILKIGQYGNEDSKGKNSKEPLGGDEVGLFHPCFVAVHSDKRLFISDIGNEKIISVKLKYSCEDIQPLKK